MLFQRYAPAIRDLAGPAPFTRAQLLIPQFRLERQAPVSVYFAPFEYVNPLARLALIGITPGWTQMEIAYRVARAELRAGTAPNEIGRRVKQSASFAGSMRANLLQMLGLLEIPRHLGLKDPADLFGSGWDLVHTTSILRYPVFVGDDEGNYTGHSPPLGRSVLIMSWIDEWFVPEIRSVPEALLIPLGGAVGVVLEKLVSQGHIAPERCLFGFPHPSGANGHRQTHFAERLAGLRDRVAEHFASRGSAV